MSGRYELRYLLITLYNLTFIAEVNILIYFLEKKSVFQNFIIDFHSV